MANSRNKGSLFLLILAVTLLISGYQVGFSGSRIVTGLPHMAALIQRMFRPQWSYAPAIVDSLRETLLMALISSIIGTIIALPISVLAAENISPHPYIYRTVRGLMAMIRTIPHVFWAALLVSILGLGKLAGIVALVITSCNVVTKLLSEYIENLDKRHLESVVGVGASYIAILVYAVLPRITQQLWSLFFFSLETNTRAATVLGLVGAGGIGQLLWRDLNFLRYDRVATIIVLLFLTVATIDILSYLARRHYISLPSLLSYTDYKTFRKRFWLRILAFSGCLIFTACWIVVSLELDFSRVWIGLHHSKPMLTRLFQLDLSYAYRLWQGLRESFFVAIFATLIGSLMAIPLAFLAAMNLWNQKTWPYLYKLLINMVRTFPSIILAIMFFRGLGPGPLAGALALSIYTSGVLGKLYSEILETIDVRIMDAIRATGASRLQIWFYSLWPQVMPDFVAASLYRLESNIRTATVLGIIGAGGIGTYLMMNLSARHWERVGLLLVGMMALILAVDWTSSYIRRKITII